jgi:hypothetical protein
MAKAGDATGWVHYKTLSIDVGPKTLRVGARGLVDDQGRELPLHIIRGHIADFRNGAGLFGKYKMLVWMPMHFRGKQSAGAVSRTCEAVAGSSADPRVNRPSTVDEPASNWR